MAERQVLIIGPNWIGDMVMANALFQVLHQQSGTVIDVVAPEWCMSLLYRMPEVRRVINSPVAHGKIKIKQRYQLGKQLRQSNYDQAIILPNSFKSALIPFFAHIKQRTGWVGECRRGILNDARHLDKGKYTKMVQQYIALAYNKSIDWDGEHIPFPHLKVNQDTVAHLLERHNLNLVDKPVLALSPGAAYGPAKRWPQIYFAEVARHMLHQGWQVWLFGSDKDKPIAQAIQAYTNNQCIDFMGKLELKEVVDLISQITLLIANDSGLLHVAAALSKPVIGIYGSTTTDFTPPLSDNAHILALNLACRPCFKRKCPLKHLKCLYDIKPQMVLDKIYKMGLMREKNRAC